MHDEMLTYGLKKGTSKRKEIQNRRTYCVEVNLKDLLETNYTENDVIAGKMRHGELISLNYIHSNLYQTSPASFFASF